MTLMLKTTKSKSPHFLAPPCTIKYTAKICSQIYFSSMKTVVVDRLLYRLDARQKVTLALNGVVCLKYRVTDALVCLLHQI